MSENNVCNTASKYVFSIDAMAQPHSNINPGGPYGVWIIFAYLSKKPFHFIPPAYSTWSKTALLTMS